MPQLWSCSRTPVSQLTIQLKTRDGPTLCQGSWRTCFQPLTTSRPVSPHRARQKAGDFARIVLQVGVERHDEFAAGRPESRRQRRRLAEIAAKANAVHPRIVRGQPAMISQEPSVEPSSTKTISSAYPWASATSASSVVQPAQALAFVVDRDDGGKHEGTRRLEASGGI